MFKEYVFPALRILLYVLFFAYFIIIPTEQILSGAPCVFEQFFNTLSPTCGVTRSFTYLLDLRFWEVIHFNEFFAFFLFPFSVFVMVQDTFTYIRKLITKKKVPSFLEKMVGIK